MVQVQLGSEESHWVGGYNANVDHIFARELLTNLGWVALSGQGGCSALHFPEGWRFRQGGGEEKMLGLGNSAAVMLCVFGCPW